MPVIFSEYLLPSDSHLLASIQPSVTLRVLTKDTVVWLQEERNLLSRGKQMPHMRQRFV